jgi:hypothetical protein
MHRRYGLSSACDNISRLHADAVQSTAEKSPQQASPFYPPITSLMYYPELHESYSVSIGLQTLGSSKHRINCFFNLHYTAATTCLVNASLPSWTYSIFTVHKTRTKSKHVSFGRHLQ